MDIAILINEFLKGKESLRTEDDSLNIVDNQIAEWNFINIPCPTAEDLAACELIISQQQSKELILKQIKDLEELITPRRIRESIISGDKSYIESIDAQIALLRATL